jgi:glycosyltransferase involved in cell wall biosynthesis
MPRTPRVSVIIPTKDRPEELKRMLASLDKQTFRNFETLVINANDYPGGLVVQENVGLRLAKGDIYVRTDDDAEAPSQWLEEIVKTFDTYLCDGVTGPTVTTNADNRDLFLYQDKLKNGNWFWRMVGKIYYDYILEGKVHLIGKVMQSGAFTLGSNMPEALRWNFCWKVDVHDCCTLACKTSRLREIGGFDERFNGVGDLNEPDVSLRLGTVIFNPKAWIYHHVSRGGIYEARLNPWPRLQNFIYFHRKHFKFNLRFVVYVLFQGGYYAYSSLRRHVSRQVCSA